MGPTGALEVVERSACVHRASGADTTVAFENLFAEITRVGAKLPFVDAPVGAEREAPRGNFQLTPSA